MLRPMRDLEPRDINNYRSREFLIDKIPFLVFEV